ncbi:hypothetical protein [Pseudomonas luteola]|uniref:Uncharacterized protein n=1 Tax=Pseudomonas luteola TaxID=47886 RepID=A0ABS0FIE7_PSELU|nr:hypothetical protein [Pseudomonas zeshuii]MBF8640117.1 hypothetical protein [Pseudomonas zeshuii]
MRGIERAFNKTQAQRDVILTSVYESNASSLVRMEIRNTKRELDKVKSQIVEADKKLAALQSENEDRRKQLAEMEAQKVKALEAKKSADLKALVAKYQVKPVVAPTAPAEEKDPSVVALEAALAKMFPKRK